MRDKFWTLMLIVFFVVAGLQTIRVGQAQEREAAALVRADSLLADAAISRLEADSVWEARIATEVDNLSSQLANGNEERQRLIDELEGANIRVGLLAEVNAVARGNIISLGEQLSAAEAAQISDDDATVAWRGDIDDGLLTGRWQFLLPQAQHTLDYNVDVPGDLIVSVTGDGRTLITARSTHERAALNLGEIFVDPPPPVEVRRLSFTQAALFYLAGIITWEFAR